MQHERPFWVHAVHTFKHDRSGDSHRGGYVIVGQPHKSFEIGAGLWLQRPWNQLLLVGQSEEAGWDLGRQVGRLVLGLARVRIDVSRPEPVELRGEAGRECQLARSLSRLSVLALLLDGARLRVEEQRGLVDPVLPRHVGPRLRLRD